MLLLKSVFPEGNLSYWANCQRSGKLWLDCPLFPRQEPFTGRQLATLLDSMLEGLPLKRVFCWVADYKSYLGFCTNHPPTEIWEGDRFIAFSGNRHLNSLCLFRRGLIGVSPDYSRHLSQFAGRREVYYEELPRAAREKLDRLPLDFEFVSCPAREELDVYQEFAALVN